MHIYDRWGNLVFVNENLIINDPDSGWDPRQSLGYSQGVFVYVIEYIADENSPSPSQITGTITVIR